VRVLDNLRSALRAIWVAWLPLIIGSILDRDLVRESHEGVTLFFISRPWRACRNPYRSRTNAPRSIPGVSNCFGRSGAAGVKKTDLQQLGCNLRRRSDQSKIESMRADPKNPYATSKMRRTTLSLFTDEGRLATFSLRYFTFFVYQDPRNEYGGPFLLL